MARRNPATSGPLLRWTVDDSRELYSIARWSDDYFNVNEHGNITVTPRGHMGDNIDLKELVDEIRMRGIKLPLLLRFSDILRSRIELLNHSFARAITECGYKGSYRGVYPIKVNQSRTVVEEIVEFGRPFHYGLEAGSKPELLATLAKLTDPEALIICNGYKDDDYINMALLASKLGRNIILVVEKPSELEHVHRVGLELGVKPRLGIRARLSARGSGKWEQSGGDHSKFGLSVSEILDAVVLLKEWGELDCVRLLHFHLGSQISSIRSIKGALVEAARIYVGLREQGCESLQYVDVGGGLGVDYDGSQTNFASSMNYTVQEYANDVVFEVQRVCDAVGAPHPDLVTEAGRAVTAHHSVLVVNVLETSQAASHGAPDVLPESAGDIATMLFDTLQSASTKNTLETFHDAIDFKDQALQLFNLGHLSLDNRALCERLFWAICRKLSTIVQPGGHVHDDLLAIERALADTYFLNFSMFQSLPDAWAIDQLFPIVPIHRLDQEPSRRGVLADITCDSDGAIDRFIDPRDVKKVLELHPYTKGDPYYLGIFLVGAYQEILGDLHNLFGDTACVHVSLGPDGRYVIEEVFDGDSVTDVLKYVNYDPQDLLKQLRKSVEAAVRDGKMSISESRQLIDAYWSGLAGYTYLDNDQGS